MWLSVTQGGLSLWRCGGDLLYYRVISPAWNKSSYSRTAVVHPTTVVTFIPHRRFATAPQIYLNLNASKRNSLSSRSAHYRTRVHSLNGALFSRRYWKVLGMKVGHLVTNRDTFNVTHGRSMGYIEVHAGCTLKRYCGQLLYRLSVCDMCYAILFVSAHFCVMKIITRNCECFCMWYFSMHKSVIKFWCN